MLKSLWNLLNSIIVFTLAFVFVRWNIKGHFGKYFLLFWLNTIMAIALQVNRVNHQQPYDHRTGAEVWEEQYGKSY